MMNYCMSCGCKNDLNANFCNKCGKPMKAAASTPSPPIHNEEDDEDGVSLNYVPKVHQIEVEAMEIDEPPSIKLGAIIEAARQQESKAHA